MNWFKEYLLTGQFIFDEATQGQMEMYHRLTMLLHPDREKGDEEIMKNINNLKDKGDWQAIAKIYRQYVGEPPEEEESEEEPDEEPDEDEEYDDRWQPPRDSFGNEGEPWRVQAAKNMEAVVKELDQYLAGDVWGYIITAYTADDEEGEVIDSVWGFYGYDYCKQEAEAQATWFKKDDRKERIKRTFMIKIVQDEDPMDPYKEFDHVGEIAHWHHRGFWGEDIGARTREWVYERRTNDDIVLPLYLFEHSGQRISTHPFGDPWDSGQVGYIWCSKEQAMKEWGTPPKPSKPAKPKAPKKIPTKKKPTP